MSVPVYRIATPRLDLRPLDARDADALHLLWTDEQVRHYLWNERVIPPEETRSIIRKSGSLFGKHGFGLWGVRERGSDALMGVGGYWYFHEPPVLEVLYAVAPKWWNRGVATEIARTLIRFGFDVIGLDVVRASTDAPNRPSARVLEKAGMQFAKRATTQGLDTEFYLIRREDHRPSDARFELQTTVSPITSAEP